MLGLALVQHLAVLPEAQAWGGAGLVALGLGLVGARSGQGRSVGLGGAVLGLFCLGVAWASAQAQWRLDERLDPAWEGRDLVIEAEVDGLPTALPGWGGASGWRLPLRSTGWAHDAHGDAQVPVPRGLSLTWFEGRDRWQAPRAGERWRLVVRLKRVHLPQNPGLPDTELWLLERGVRAQGSVRAGERLAEAPWHDLHALRERLRDAIYGQVAEPRHRAVLAGLVLGDQAGLPAADWALLRDAGVVHLFAISGLHITGFAWLMGWAVRGLWRRWPQWGLHWPAPSAARWLGLLAAWGYALLAGWGVPAQRTVGLLAVLALLASMGRLWPWPLALLLAGAVVGAADPWALVQPGFWLSFVAVAVLMNGGSLPGESGPRWRQAVHELVRTQAWITFGLLPLSLLFFGQVSLVGLVSNLVAVPLVSLALVPLALVGVALPWAWHGAGWLIDALWALMQAMVAWPGAVWAPAQAPNAVAALALVGTAVALWRLPRAWRLAGLLSWVPLLCWSPARPPPGAFRLLVLDVGQGSAVWLQTARHDLLLDAGPGWGAAGQDAGARWVLPMLRAQGVSRLDALVVSHADSDHSGGALSVARGLPVEAVVGSLPPGHPLAARARPCQAGERWDWDGVQLRWLHPLPGAEGADNAISCVLHVRDAAGRAALLPADLPAAQERALVARSPAGSLRAELLLAPHHGSATSSSAEWLAAVAPQWALAQSGYRNRHGHPALSVQQRYHAAGVPLLTSAECGAYEWRSASGVPSAEGCWRLQRRRYWHTPEGAPATQGASIGPDAPPTEP
jgi:competence protein ComEC